MEPELSVDLVLLWKVSTLSQQSLLSGECWGSSASQPPRQVRYSPLDECENISSAAESQGIQYSRRPRISPSATTVFCTSLLLVSVAVLNQMTRWLLSIAKSHFQLSSRCYDSWINSCQRYYFALFLQILNLDWVCAFSLWCEVFSFLSSIFGVMAVNHNFLRRHRHQKRPRIQNFYLTAKLSHPEEMTDRLCAEWVDHRGGRLFHGCDSSRCFFWRRYILWWPRWWRQWWVRRLSPA